MFSSSELEGIPHPLQTATAQLEDRIMEDLVMRIKESGEISSTADWRINRLQILGKSKEDIRKELQHLLEFTDSEMDSLYSDVLGKAYLRDKRLYLKTGKKFIDFKKNKELQTYIRAIKKQSKEEFKNITGTIGFAKKVSGKIQFTELSKYYQETLDSAISDVLSGTFSYDEVLKRVVGEVTNSGLRTVDYASGRTMRIESAIRNALMTGFNQTVSKMNDEIATKLDTEYFEIDWHGGARPSHQVWQGKVYSRKELETACGLGTAGGLLGVNCYHSYFPFIPGASVRNYTDKQLDRMSAKENKPKEYLGKEYTTYEATQKQRKMELLMRKQRQEIKLLKDGGADKEEIIAVRSRYRSTNAQYVEFSEKLKLPQQKQRVYVDGLGRKG